MSQDNVNVSSSQGAGRQHELALSEGKDLTPDHPAILHPAAEHQRQDEVLDPLSQKSHDGNGQEQEWKGEKDFRGLVDHFVGQLSKIASDRS